MLTKYGGVCMQITKAKLKQLIKEALSAQNEAMSDDEVFAITRASSKAERAGWRSDEFEHFKDLVMNAIERAVPEATDEALQSIAQNMRAHLENLSADLRDTPGGLMPRLTREFLAALAVEAARISPQLELPMNEGPGKATMKLTKSKLKQIIKEELSSLREKHSPENEVFLSTIDHHSMVLASKMKSIVSKVYETLERMDLERTEERQLAYAAAQELNELKAQNPLANVVLDELKFLMSPAVLVKEVGDSLVSFDE